MKCSNPFFGIFSNVMYFSINLLQLCLRVAQKNFVIAFSFSSVFLDGHSKAFYVRFKLCVSSVS